ncbi:MAG: peptidoglycan bridge formation glycyltransferase FemA/FemB family protein [Chloroflexi bacterium]|nr:MAG: peptidoglycan bridge formation glycyltransferase FemA/FemB family protein [Chloroflexota bacterium]
MAFTNQQSGGEEWDRLVAAVGGHLLQTWPWGELKARFGWQVERVAAGPALAQVLFRRLPAGLGSIAYVPRGPAGDLDDPAALSDLQAAIRPLARRRRAICLKIEPDREEDAALAGHLQALGFRPSTQGVQPRRTLVVDLQGEPEAVLGRMKQKTRYNVRLAARKGVAVRPGSEADLPAFNDLMEQTARRDGFAIHSRAYYEAAHDLFVACGRGCLLLAEHQGRLLAGLVAMAFGQTACYMYGASSDEQRELMPTYLLQWEAMLWARRQGCLRYDLWGVPDAGEEILEAGFAGRSDGLWGVYRFKRGFGGRLVRTIGAWDLVYAPLGYRLYSLALALRERLALARGT